MMVSPIHGRTVIDINATVDRHRPIMKHLLTAHGLTGCDTVAPCYGIGKGVALKVLADDRYPLENLGDERYTLNDVVSQATRFMLACYGQHQCATLSEVRQRMWNINTGKSGNIG